MTSIEWAVAAEPKPGCAVSGDAYCVRTFLEGTLVVVMDGIGHGPEAKAAADAAAAVVAGLATPPALTALIQLCHEASRRTRGVVMSAVWFPAAKGELAWAGVGNVDGVVRKQRSRTAPGRKLRERLSTAGGIVGDSKLPRFQTSTVALDDGDLVILATDGAPGAVLADGPAWGSAQSLADGLLATHSNKTDDALVFVAHWRGVDGP